MTLFRYIHDKLLLIILNFSGLLLLSFYLLTVGNTLLTIILIDLIWGSVLFIYLGIDYYQRQRYFNGITRQMAQLDKPYLIYELMEHTWRYEDELHKEILRESTLSAMEAIVSLEEDQSDYKEFIEAWIHEVKLPMTSLHLMSAEMKGNAARKLETYLIDLENQVDQALFYARSDYVHQDYLIQEVYLQDIINELIKKNKYLLIHNQMQVTVDCEVMVHTDKKWLTFIVNQVLFNAVKYKKADSGELSFRTISTKDNTKLVIRDNGIGIKAHELPRIFTKGFTGTNGRDAGKATGFGLYLCKKLCAKLGLTITGDSVEEEYTEITITLPKNSYLSEL
ncbi:sensor histidine kinase [Enterococcus sp. BWR-S5]|uniref:sensor histidine kinase n=1 Tax=Enterococcus sp. BWR-S5 TaxID=2787714 RepID=UPI001922F6BA|nr:sensor histidine kinase [Enterococcus sp. BWR-S5]MBL1225022.1 sensor histidine kinase [Enterococcus sp. BWR-S5]